MGVQQRPLLTGRASQSALELRRCLKMQNVVIAASHGGAKEPTDVRASASQH